MPEVYLVRHGQASLGAANYDQLSPLGFEQSRLLGEYFAERDIHFDRVITGAMARHKQTADTLLSAMNHSGAVPEVGQGWNEFDFEGLAKAFLAQHPDQAPAPDAPKKAFFGVLKSSLQAWAKGELPEHALSETWQAFDQRVHQALANVATPFSSLNDKNKKVLVVSSGGAIAMALKQILNAPAETMIALNLQTANTAVSRCFFGAQGFNLHSFNHLPHLHESHKADQITFF